MSIIEAGSLRGWSETFTGRQFYPLAPNPEDVDPVDIAHSLSMQCRYNGHTRFFYSVATHCVLMADYALRNSGDTQAALCALLHDASEAYCGDVVRPLKHQLDGFKEIERGIQDCIMSGLKVETDPTSERWVKTLDNRICHDERRQVMLSQRNQWVTDELRPLGVTIPRWPAELARVHWLARFYWWHVGIPCGDAMRSAAAVFALTEGTGDVRDSDSIH